MLLLYYLATSLGETPRAFGWLLLLLLLTTCAAFLSRGITIYPSTRSCCCCCLLLWAEVRIIQGQVRRRADPLHTLLAT
jgi:hypothetical protein